ncbi:hypothetical protein PIPA1_00330 [Pelosinus sp. IPA-1]|nr:hypothetical protein PIPA1_00330 [Pelosinus sp. IPA-1]
MDSDSSIPHIILKIPVLDTIYDLAKIFTTRRNYLWHFSQPIYQNTV